MPTHSARTQATAARHDRPTDTLDARLAVFFWALLFILAGGIWLFPEGQLPPGIWLTGIGLILLALNAIRLLNGVPVRVLPSLVGALALAAGVGSYSGVSIPIVPLTLIAIGASIVLQLLSAQKPRRSADRR